MQLTNANAWASLTAGPAAAPAAAATPPAPQQQQQPEAENEEEEEEDNLWSEFQGREQQQRQQVGDGPLALTGFGDFGQRARFEAGLVVAEWEALQGCPALGLVWGVCVVHGGICCSFLK